MKFTSLPSNINTKKKIEEKKNTVSDKLKSRVANPFFQVNLRSREVVISNNNLKGIETECQSNQHNACNAGIIISSTRNELHEGSINNRKTTKSAAKVLKKLPHSSHFPSICPPGVSQ